MKNLEDKPFALIGVNTNGYEAKKLKDVMDKEKLNWRSFVDARGKGGLGTISTKWNLVGTPTLYVLDHKGTIRYKDVRGGDLNRAVETLLKEQEAGFRQKK